MKTVHINIYLHEVRSYVVRKGKILQSYTQKEGSSADLDKGLTKASASPPDLSKEETFPGDVGSGWNSGESRE